MHEALALVRQDTLIYWFVPIFFMALALEFSYSKYKAKEWFQPADTVASLWMMVFVVAVDVAPKLLAFVVFIQLYELSPLKDVIGQIAQCDI